MKKIVVTQHGGPEVMHLENVSLGEPEEGEIKVRNHAIGVNYTDIYTRTGGDLPLTPGKEGAGEVIAVGKGVEEFKTGDRVVYTQSPGAYGEEHIVSAHLTLPLPEEMSYELAAASTLKGLTAHYLIHHTYPVQAGEVALVHAAAGGVGNIMTQWLKSKGVTVIGTVGSSQKAEIAQQSGCDLVIEYRHEDVAQRVSEFTNGKGCDVVYDGVGKATFEASLDSLHPFGYYVNFGAASGPVELEMGTLAAKGSLYATFPDLDHHVTNYDHLLSMGNDLFSAIKAGTIQIAEPKQLALSDAAKAHELLESRKATKTIVLIP